jgi:hypothetical protein
MSIIPVINDESIIHYVKGTIEHTFDIIDMKLFSIPDIVNFVSCSTMTYRWRKRIIINKLITYKCCKKFFLTGTNNPIIKRMSITDLKQLANIPKTVIEFNMCISIHNFLSYIPNHIREITFTKRYNHPSEIPNFITKVNFGYDYNQSTPLPNSITDLKFGYYYNQPTPLPNSITDLEFGYNYNQSTSLPESITRLIFGASYNQSTPLPNSIIDLEFGNYYNQPTILPQYLQILKFGSYYNQPTVLPNSLINVVFPATYDHATVIPKSVESILIFVYTGCSRKVSLTNLKLIRMVKLPNKFHKLKNSLPQEDFYIKLKICKQNIDPPSRYAKVLISGHVYDVDFLET